MSTILHRGRHAKKSLHQTLKKSLSIGAAVAITGGLVLVPQISDPASMANAVENSASSTPTSTSADPTWVRTVTAESPASETAESSAATESTEASETPVSTEIPEAAETTAPAEKPAPAESPASAETETASPSGTADPSESASPSATETPEATEAAKESESAAETDEAVQGDDIAVPMTIPDATATTAVISVKVGGDRRADGTVAPLAGVKLGLYGAGTASRVGSNGLVSQGTAGVRYDATWSWTTCVSDAEGDCSFVIPIRADPLPSSTGVAQDTRFWVLEEGSPTGWYSNPTLRVGGQGATPDGPLAYRFRTDKQLRAGTIYRSTTPMPTFTAQNFDLSPDSYFMRNGLIEVPDGLSGDISSNDLTPGLVTRTTGVWNQSRNNPAFPAKCGMNVALIADTSGSLGTTGLADLKASMGSFVDAFRGTDTSMSLFSFANDSPADGNSNHPSLLPVTTAAQGSTFKAQYAGWNYGGGTNWDRGLAAAANASAKFDLAILLTDGLPTTSGNHRENGNYAGTRNSLRATDAGIFSANQLKAQGTRLIGLGVGPAVTANGDYNLRAVSGPTKNSDYFRANNFAAATAEMVKLANANCSGSIEVQKMIVPANGTIDDATAAPAGWKFDATSQTSSSMTVSAPASQTTATGGNGKVDFGLSFTAPATTGTIQILETQQEGYQIFPVGTKDEPRNGTCKNLNTGATVLVTNSGSANQPGFTVSVLKNERVSCQIYNKVVEKVEEPGKLEVAKSSNPASGTTVAPGQTLTYTLTFKNTGGQPVTVDQEDVLTGVLDDAALVGAPVAQSPLVAALNGAGNRIKVTGELAPGDTKTVTYQVKVKDPLPASADGKLGNYVVKTGDNPPPTCEPEQPCTVHPVRVTLSWNKVDPTGNKLKGSEWKLVPLKSDGTPNQVGAIVVQDCVAASAADCTGADKNPAVGAFLLTGLVPGKYQLLETRAPAGYQLLEDEIDLVVNTNLGFGDIVNDLVEVPVLPLTGGMGSYLFMGAALICVVFVAAALLLQRRQVRIRALRQ